MINSGKGIANIEPVYFTVPDFPTRERPIICGSWNWYERIPSKWLVCMP